MDIKDIISYNPDTGQFHLKVDRSPRSKKGDRCGWLTDRGYRMIEVNGKGYSEQRLAFLLMTGELPIKQMDHINGIKDDNRWYNLREASPSENSCNKPVRPDSGTGIKGVAYYKETNRYHVQITVNGKQQRFGCYEGLELAELVAREVRNKYHGDFARH